MKRITATLSLALASLVIFMSSCQDEQKVQTALVRTFLVDAPGDYQQVLVDVQAVRFHVSGDTTSDSANGWQDLEGFTPAVYDLLELTNGTEALLGEIEITDEKVGQVRLVLGDNNSVMVDSMSYPLTIPSGAESGLKIIINEKVEPGFTYNLILDFDAARSIKETGKGDYKLRPVIKTHFEATSGSIAGVVEPANNDVVVYAIDANNDTNSTFPSSEGNFLFHSLDAGTYDVTAVSDSLGNSSTESTTVVIGETAVVDTLRF